MTFLRVNKNYFRPLYRLLILCLLLANQPLQAQSDSLTYGHFTDSATLKEDSSIMASNAKTTYEGLDTTGKYFNSKDYSREPFDTGKINSRLSSGSAVEKMRNEDDFWYVKSVEDFKKNAVRLHTDKKYRDSLAKEGLLPPDEQVFTQEPDGNAWYLQPWVSYLIWTVIISIFLGAIGYFLLTNKINIFSRTATRSVVEEAQTEDNLLHMNYDQLLEKYIREKNYRFAVRALYLQLLKTLNEKELIVFQPQFTNTHYLQQLYNTSFYNEFFTVTRHYEFIWYGEFTVTETTFQKIQSDFANLKNKVSRR